MALQFALMWLGVDVAVAGFFILRYFRRAD